MTEKKLQALEALTRAVDLATSSGLFDDEMLGVIKNADSINDFCDAVTDLELQNK